MKNTDLLQVSVTQLGFTPGFLAQCEKMGFGKLEDILILGPAELIAVPGFTYHWMGELSAFLEEKGLLHLLQTTPGKSPG